MTQDVHTALASWFDRYEIRRQLHDVPPHAVYEVTVDGRRAVCKVARGETADVGAEAAAMDHVDRHTDIPVPSVLAAREDAFVATWLDALADDDVDRDDPTDARALGRGLARLHAATADAYSTAAFVMADDRASSVVAARDGLSALFLTRDGDRRHTDGWDDLRADD